MRKRIAALLMLAATAPLVASCSSGSEEQVAPAGSASAIAPIDANAPEASGAPAAGNVSDTVQRIRGQFEDAYNKLPSEEQLPYEQYIVLFQPIWDAAKADGITLYRRPLLEVDGFTLPPEEAFMPGHSFFLEAEAGSQTWCIADTLMVPDNMLSAEQRASREETPPEEFVVLDGSCTKWIDDVVNTMSTEE